MTTSAQLHRESIIVDGLNASYFQDAEVLQRLQRGGLTAVNATIAAWHTMAETVGIIADLYAHVERHAASVMLARTVADIHVAKAAGKVGMIFGFQDTRPLEDQLNLLRVYHALGVRVIQLTYNESNRVGSGCLAPNDAGLSDFGRAVVAEMNRLGMLVDLSHCGPRTTLEAIGASAKPVAFTHANAHARCPHPRNKSDEAIRALVGRGGVIGAVTLPFMLTGRTDATLDDVLAMIDYLVEVAGVDYVGIGADFMENMPEEVLRTVLGAGRAGPPPPEMLKLFNSAVTRDFESVAKFGNLTDALLKHGYAAADVQKIMGLNWLRLYAEVWQEP